MNLAVWPLAVVVDVCSSVGGIATRPFTILYIIVAFILALLSAKVGHCRVCSIDVTGLSQPLVESTSLETFKEGVLSCHIP
jgi:hypothetical protein